MLANNQICLLAVSTMNMLHLGSQVKSRLLIGQQCRIKIINLNKILAFSARVLFRVEELRLVVPTENSVFADLSTINRAIAWLIDERHILPSKSGIYGQYGDIYQCGRSMAVRRSRDKVLQGDWLRSQWWTCWKNYRRSKVWFRRLKGLQFLDIPSITLSINL